VSEGDFERVCGAKVLHYGGTGLLKAMDDSGQAAKLLAHAKTTGVVTTMDLIAPSEDTINLLRPILPYVDYFMPSMEEALFLSKASTPGEAAKFFMDLGAGACIFKWGYKGSFVKTKSDMQSPSWCPRFSETHRIPAYKVNVKDTTGCGDAYCGGFVAGLVQDMNVLDACRLGTAAAAALVATGLGSDAGVIDLTSTLRFIDETDIVDHDE
jgi:sugar/nucleoside kinase (ribokinase family)